jgi:hypothetical protein
VGAPGAGPLGASQAKVVSGAGSATLHSFDATTAREQFEFAVSSAGDANADGFDDIAVGSPTADPSGMTNAERLTLFSGMNGAILFTVNGPGLSANFGWTVAPVGDVTGDGRGDIAVGAPGTDGA